MILKDQKDERHRKIGRNLVLLQKLELLLKDLIFRGNLTVKSNPKDTQFPSLEEQVEKQKRSIQNQTLGYLAKEFKKSVLDPLPKFPSNKDSNEETITISFGIAYGTTEQQNRLKDQLETVRGERNKLVHELLTSFDLTTNEGFVDMDKFLENQHKLLLPIVKNIEVVRENFVELVKTIADRPLNSKISKDCNSISCVTELLVCLCVFEDNIKGTGDYEWISLAAAKRYLNNLFPEAIPQCRRHYNVKSLKKILCKTGIFDVQRLSTDNRKEMVFYRMKHEYSLGKDESGELYLCSKSEEESGGCWEEKVSLGMFLEKQKTLN